MNLKITSNVHTLHSECAEHLLKLTVCMARSFCQKSVFAPAYTLTLMLNILIVSISKLTTVVSFYKWFWQKSNNMNNRLTGIWKIVSNLLLLYKPALLVHIYREFDWYDLNIVLACSEERVLPKVWDILMDFQPLLGMDLNTKLHLD